MVESDTDDEREANELVDRSPSRMGVEQRDGGGDSGKGTDMGDKGAESREGGADGKKGGVDRNGRDEGEEEAEGSGRGQERQEGEDGEEGAQALRRVATFRPSQNRNAITRFWTRQVVLSVHHEDCRDHFALERTYLAYFRISLALAILGVVIAQLFRLQNQVSKLPSSPTSPSNPSNPASPTHSAFGFFRLGIPLAAICHGTAILVTFIGGWRFWRQQNALARGKVHVGGWEIKTVGFIALIAEIAIFVLVVALEAA
ncbi:hypothetical protein MMC30_000079 [Trapelia coarctata]|nr:hypothetical protein [Trapelia coarctata]